MKRKIIFGLPLHEATVSESLSQEGNISDKGLGAGNVEDDALSSEGFNSADDGYGAQPKLPHILEEEVYFYPFI